MTTRPIRIAWRGIVPHRQYVRGSGTQPSRGTCDYLDVRGFMKDIALVLAVSIGISLNVAVVGLLWISWRTIKNRPPDTFEGSWPDRKTESLGPHA